MPKSNDELAKMLNTTPDEYGMVRVSLNSINELVKEARYMGSADFANWVLTHDQSSFRQERAWYKIKPSWLLQYQAELVKNLKRVRSDTGLDPDATVPQLKYEGPAAKFNNMENEYRQARARMDTNDGR